MPESEEYIIQKPIEKRGRKKSEANIRLDEQVKALRPMSYEDMARILGVNTVAISNSSSRLLKEGRTTRMKPHIKAPKQEELLGLLEQFRKEHSPRKRINLAEFGRRIGVTRQRAHELYDLLTQEHKLPPKVVKKGRRVDER